LRAGQPVTVQVVASVNDVLSGWVDFDRDGSWAGAGEQVFTNQNLVAGANTLQFVVAADAVPGSTFARFRFSSAGGLSFSGPAPDGEVEDYRVTIDPTVDLTVSQTDAPDPVALGANVTYGPRAECWRFAGQQRHA
jgi:hypothetical protein